MGKMTLTDSAKIELNNLDTLCRTLENGDCIGLPTETVYGLAADATNGIGVARIFEMKGRPKFNPLICHVSSIEMAEAHGVLSEQALKLVNAFWPGPLTLVVPLQENSNLHPLVTAELGSVGLRYPQGIATDIIEQFGKPLAAPSANRSGKISPTIAQHVREEFPELMVLDNGACDIGLESTILKVTDDEIVLLRPGAITPDMIAKVIGIHPAPPKDKKIEAPGMMQSHYAPNAAVKLNVETFSTGSAALAFGEVEVPKDTEVFNLSETDDLIEAAANLYAGLKTLDKSDASIIEVSPIPNEGLGLAINDRLKRAAAPRGD